MSDILSLHEDTGNSRAANEEVTIISSDSEPLPKQKIRRVTRKVRFSHALAYQDPQFLLKRQIYQSRRQTRTSKDADLSSGLPEVTIISSDSEPLPKQKIRRVTRKVRFSHALAYQDPQFLLKRQIYQSRRQTRTSKDADLSSGLPEASRKRRTEVISDLYPFHPLAGVTRQPLNSSYSNYQGTSPSSGDSMQSSLPAFKTAPG